MPDLPFRVSRSAFRVGRRRGGMRVVVQRVSRAAVRVHGRVTGSIGVGFLILAGFAPADSEESLIWMADKVLGLRVFGDAAGKMNLALADVGGALLVVSQFTLYGDVQKGRRDRKSTRLNSSHLVISYAVFCLKKKTQHT